MSKSIAQKWRSKKIVFEWTDVTDKVRKLLSTRVNFKLHHNTITIVILYFGPLSSKSWHDINNFISYCMNLFYNTKRSVFQGKTVHLAVKTFDSILCWNLDVFNRGEIINVRCCWHCCSHFFLNMHHNNLRFIGSKRG